MHVAWRRYRRGEPNVVQAWLLRLLLLVGGLGMVMPFGWMVTTALKDKGTMEREAGRWLPKWPRMVESASWSVDYLYGVTSDFAEADRKSVV